MTRTIVIDPVTRLEGHARITLQTDNQGEVEAAYFHVTQLRGFEKFCEGRPFYEMPTLMSRICGICPVSHLITSAKACDAILAVRVPPAAAKLRRILNLAQIVQSHALSFFYLSSPDLLLGLDSEPSERNIFGVARANPELGRGGVRLRQFGQQVIELLGGKKIHPGWVIPGGVNEPLSIEKRDRILGMIPEALAITQKTLGWFKKRLESYREEIRTFANFPSLFMGLITWVNLIIATGHNNLAMNRGLLQVARHFVHGEKLTDGMLNRVEAVIRAFDPCLSCSTHAAGQMALHIKLVTRSGELLDEVKRS